MSSQLFASSPVSPNNRRVKKSRFTYKHLSTFANASPTCPLRVIAHIDLDAFYAQCETVRLGIDPSIPLAVQQWQGLIAINYPARAFGLTRHVTITEAKEKCPEIICQHVATWKEGDTMWSYSDDAFKEIATRKVSLDPYRLQSRRILACIKECLPQDMQKVEKASIDEVFLDLSMHVHSIMLERYPMLRGPAPYDDPSEPLPRPPTTVLDWAADALVDLDGSQSEEDDPDWDDIAMLIASEIVRDVRKAIFDKLHYTCSAGLSRNKMLAKLGSAHKKPNSQTVVRNRAVQHFLSSFKFTKIRNLGGKLGDEVVAAFNTDTVAELLPVPMEQLKKQMGDDTGSWLYNIIRGEDHSEVNPRTAIKSMLSAKSFRPSINDKDVACKWLRIFVADIFSRLVEEGVLENKRRPKTINLHHRQGAQTRSKQSPISMGKAITEDGLFEAAKTLLAQVVVEGRAWPCANLSLSVGGFEDGVTGNKGIGGFLVRGDEAKALKESLQREDSGDGKPDTDTPPPSKKRRTGEAITSFFGAPRQDSGGATGRHHAKKETDVKRQSDAMGESDISGEADVELENVVKTRLDVKRDCDEAEVGIEEKTVADGGERTGSDLVSDPLGPPPSAQIKTLTPHQPLEAVSEDSDGDDDDQTYTCPECSERMPANSKAEHEDFHFAQSLQNEASSPPHRPPPKPVPPPTNTRASNHGSGAGGGRGRARGRGRPPASAGYGPEKGQRRLAFG